MISAKWIGGILGWVSGGPIGALLGFILGSVLERQFDIFRQVGDSSQGGGYSRGGGYSQGGYTGSSGGYAGGSQGGYSQTYRRTTGSRGYTATEQRNSFMVSLLVLSSAVIKADGTVRQQELDCVRDFIRRNFGEAAVDEAMRILQGLNAQNLDIYSVGGQIADNMNYSQRLQLFHYLAQIANADGEFTKSEKEVLERIARAIRINDSDAKSILAMYYKEADSAYAVLEISPSATDDEVKSAYRRMAMKNHPDKVATLGPEVQKAAEEKFRKIQEAYETIKKERGIS